MMKKPLFHGGIFREGLRQLRTQGIVMLVLFTVFDAFPFVIALISRDVTDSIVYGAIGDEVTFALLHVSLYTIPFIAPLVLMLNAFHFQTSRRDSDFYHSLPLTRLQLGLSLLSAAATWVAIIIVGSSLALALLLVLYDPYLLYTLLPSMLLCIAGSLGGSALALSIAFFATSLSGRSLTTVAVTLLFLVGPRLFITCLLNSVHMVSDVMPWMNELAAEYYEGLLYGQYDSATSWIATIVITAAVMALAVWRTSRRPSETAGSSSVSPKVQTFFRICFAMMCSLPAILMIYESAQYENVSYYTDQTDIWIIAFIYLFVTVAYFLFELLTTKKAKNLLKATPWLAVVAALNVVCILGMNGITAYIWSVQPEADEIDSVSVVGVNEYYLQINNTVYIDLEMLENTFERDGYSKIELTSEETRQTVSDALKHSIKQAKANHYTYQPYHCQVDVIIRTDHGVYQRRIWLSQSQAGTVFGELDEQQALPHSIGAAFLTDT